MSKNQDVLSALAPAAENDLVASVELDSFTALHMQIAKEGLVPSGKRKDGHRGRNTHIDTDHSALNFPGKSTGNTSITGEDHSAITVGRLIGARQSLT